MKYTTPDLEIIRFHTEDVITTSDELPIFPINPLEEDSKVLVPKDL